MCSWKLISKRSAQRAFMARAGQLKGIPACTFLLALAVAAARTWQLECSCGYRLSLQRYDAPMQA
jgi:hypothetical protein